MDFSQALTYPFKSIAKVITIVLVMTIAFAVFLGMILNSFDLYEYLKAFQVASYYGYEFMPNLTPPSPMIIPGIIGFFVVMIVQGFWLSGYSIRVIRAAIDGFEKLPAIVFKQDLLRGFYLFLSSLLYGLVSLPFFAVLAIIIAMTASGSEAAAGLAMLSFCSAILIAIPFAIIMGWGYFVGMARYAAEDGHGALFQIWTNMRIARNNWKPSLSLAGYQFLLGLIYWFLSQFVNNAINLVSTPFLGNSFNQITILIAFLIPFMLSVGLNIVQQFSNMHLIAQYAYRIGIVDTFDEEFDKIK